MTASATMGLKSAILDPTTSPTKTLHRNLVADLVYLSPEETVPGEGDEGRWLVVEAVSDKYFGSGVSWKLAGEHRRHG
ncbi:hypothetical protein [Novosphingobium sp. B 225]|uniref:hypothetical protein n=1 Tax=Novosphingobium sp. B 225 TaxID=1961849 RepID=UPI0011250C26|nr:hypothetical protein [Novosphingobium sp. B 225]